MGNDLENLAGSESRDSLGVIGERIHGNFGIDEIKGKFEGKNVFEIAAIYSGISYGVITGDVIVKDGAAASLLKKIGDASIMEMNKIAINAGKKVDNMSLASLGLANYVSKLEKENGALKEMAVEDSLTGLLNRRGYNFAIESEVKRGARGARGNGYTFGLIGLDIDHFKNFNDTYGHAAGDEVLRKVAEVYKVVAHRDTDIVTRPGGEEFSIILPETGYEGTRKIAEDINRKVAGTVMSFADESGNVHKEAVKVSAGFATYRAGDSVESIAERADDRLYLAKNKGRNCVVGRD